MKQSMLLLIQSAWVSLDTKNLDFVFYCHIEVFTGKNPMVRTSRILLFNEDYDITICLHIFLILGAQKFFLTIEGYAFPTPHPPPHPPRNITFWPKNYFLIEIKLISCLI